MEVKVKKLHPDAIIPKYAKSGDAGMDLYATSMEKDGYGSITYGTGIALEIPEGYVGLIFPRSSIYKTGLRLSNSVGVADSGYRGEIFIKFKPFKVPYRCTRPTEYEVGDRIAQLIIMPYPQIEFVEAETLSDSDRGAGGFGSTGVK